MASNLTLGGGGEYRKKKRCRHTHVSLVEFQMCKYSAQVVKPAASKQFQFYS
jgi:hypothetical protein